MTLFAPVVRFSTLAVAALASGAYAGGVAIEYNAELGVTPADFGFVSAGPVSGKFANSGGIPGLGSAVWEVSVSGDAGGYIFDLSTVADVNAAFSLTGYVRGIQVNNDDAAVGTIERNRPTGGAAQARGASLDAGQWYFMEVEWDGVSANFEERRYRVDSATGALTLEESFLTPKTNTGSPGSGLFPNSFAFYAANDGATFLRTQFDNIRFQVITPPPPPCRAFGDSNGDELVDGADLSILLALFGQSVAQQPLAALADYNEDGVVNAADLSVLLTNFGEPCAV